jgi:hypothetical protein
MTRRKDWVYRAREYAREMESILGTCGPFDKPTPMSTLAELWGINYDTWRNGMERHQPDIMQRYAEKIHNWSAALIQELERCQPVTRHDIRALAERFNTGETNITRICHQHGIKRTPRKYGNWQHVAEAVEPGMTYDDVVRLSGVCRQTIKTSMVRYLAELGVEVVWRTQPSGDHHWDRQVVAEVIRRTEVTQ